MALLHFDGFDTYATADITKEYTTTGSGPIGIDASNGRRGGGALAAPNSSTGATTQMINKALGTNASTIIIGFNFKATGTWLASTALIQFTEGSSSQCGLGVDAAGKLYMYGGSRVSVIATAASASITTGVDAYIEVKVYIHNTAGTYEVRVNGVTVLSGSGVNTRNGTTNAYVNSIYIGANGASSCVQTGTSWLFDDMYICDGTGSAPHNDFLGDVRVDAVLPDGDGTYSQFTPSTGTTHYTLVDDATPNTTDYVSDSVIGDRDSYTMANPSLNSSTIYGVKVKAAALKDDAGARSLKLGVKSGATVSLGASKALSTSQAFYNEYFTQDPNTSAAWTQSGLNALEAVLEVA